MARKATTNAAADLAAATQTPSPSASGPTQEAGREGGAGDAASSNGAPDQVVVVEGVIAPGGGDPATASDELFSSPSSTPQGSDLVSAASQLDSDRPTIEFTGGRFTEVIVGLAVFKVGASLPAVLQMERDVTVSVDYLAARAAKRLGLDMAGWNALDDGTIASELSLEGYQLAKAIDWPWASDEDVIEITAISRDGQPYRRCGYTWAGQPQDVQVHHLVADRLKADPFILVQAESVAEDGDQD